MALGDRNAAVGRRGIAGTRGRGQPVWDAGMRSRGMAGEAPQRRSRSPGLGDHGGVTVAARLWPQVTRRQEGEKLRGTAGDREQDGGGVLFSASLSFQRSIFLPCYIQTEFRAQATPGLHAGRREGEGQGKSHREQGCWGRA